jgi:predicted site-specific integrase-resolvase
MEQLLKLSEVAQILRVSYTTLRNWDREGKLPCCLKTMGGHRRYLKSQIESLIHYTTQPEGNQDGRPE